jgi:hypothetical protein
VSLVGEASGSSSQVPGSPPHSKPPPPLYVPTYSSVHPFIDSSLLCPHHPPSYFLVLPLFFSCPIYLSHATSSTLTHIFILRNPYKPQEPVTSHHTQIHTTCTTYHSTHVLSRKLFFFLFIRCYLTLVCFPLFFHIMLESRLFLVTPFDPRNVSVLPDGDECLGLRVPRAAVHMCIYICTHFRCCFGWDTLFSTTHTSYNT